MLVVLSSTVWWGDELCSNILHTFIADVFSKLGVDTGDKIATKKRGPLLYVRTLVHRVLLSEQRYSALIVSLFILLVGVTKPLSGTTRRWQRRRIATFRIVYAGVDLLKQILKLCLCATSSHLLLHPIRRETVLFKTLLQKRERKYFLLQTIQNCCCPVWLMFYILVRFSIEKNNKKKKRWI